MKAFLSALLLAAVAWLPAGPVAAQAASTPQAGRDYVEIAGGKPWAAKPGRIEVAEVFGYSCPHCAHLEPLLKPWKAKLPRDVDFVAVPAAFGGPWDTWARAYFAASNLGLLARTHDAVFAAIHERGNLPRNPSAQELATFYASYGVTSERFLAAMADPKVDAQLQQSAALTRAWELEGTPSVVVAGRYRVLGKDFQDMLRITDWLVARERQAAAKP
ncbi:thiol:disulfide interchange protein DsbA/DsbL [Pseudoxanthomonas daejeonensis]|uniref:Thiol:disulfide interchange protein n=1 Tax=Pseudoxanthomonas daejeonensis TaxID=266062 RepID=A0ABQ6Z7U7_9GAMM|nr:thiol:disulfide interchange protein DsbA/DsbL [Pseudoxanthomonas daejeonensis]KAF1695091.1 disulfide bond formation protein DsbA [Pseudoxanthomonas daejeonensis]UNK56136.1 thiol:disulfide interchange protein DsbA/DsbL [Pseudoxanthomonas daejeonensis]